MYINTSTEKRVLADESQVTQINVKDQQNNNKDNTEMKNEPKTSNTAVSSHGDMLSISKEGAAAYSKMNNQPDTSGQTTTATTAIQKLGERKATESDSDVSTTDLSSYTKTELKQMYLDGDITKAEYDKEIRSRETGTVE